MKKVVFIGRGRPSLGSIAPCIALAQNIKFQEKGIEPVFLSYGVGFRMLKYYDDFMKINLNYLSKGGIYPGLKMNEGIYPHFHSVVKKINPYFVINCGEFYVPRYCEIEKIPCVSIINLSYLDNTTGWFRYAHNRLIEMASKSEFVLDHRFFYENALDEISEKVFYIGPLVRKWHKLIKNEIREKYGLKEDQKLILVLRGAAEDFDKPMEGKGDREHFFMESNKIAECSRDAFKIISNSFKVNMIINHGFSRVNIINNSGCVNGIFEMDFVPEIMPYIIASDLIITRAGLNILNECCYLNKPTIAVPISNDFEQLKNAQQFIRRKNAFSVKSNELSADLLAELSMKILRKYKDENCLEYQCARELQISRSFDQLESEIT